VLANAARIGTDREILAVAAEKLGVKPPELEQALFADLPGERIVRPLPPEWTPAELIPVANLDLVQKLLRRSPIAACSFAAQPAPSSDPPSAAAFSAR